MKVGEKIVYNRPYPDSFKGGKWTYKTDRKEVRIMAIAEGYAMLRHPRCMPFIESVKDLVKWQLQSTDA